MEYLPQNKIKELVAGHNKWARSKVECPSRPEGGLLYSLAAAKELAEHGDKVGKPCVVVHIPRQAGKGVGEFREAWLVVWPKPSYCKPENKTPDMFPN